MTNLEKLYDSLETASLYVTKGYRSIGKSLDDLLYEVAERIAVRVAPLTMTDVRAYDALPYDKVRSALIGQLLERVPSDYDPDCLIFEALARIPLDEVCAAPVETHMELALWLSEEGQRRGVFALKDSSR